MARLYRFITHNINEEKLRAAEKEGSLRLPEKEEPEIFFQLSRVLRARNGDNVILQADSVYPLVFQYKYQIKEIKKNEALLQFLQKDINDNELGYNLNLWLCLPNKPEKLELIIQKAVELGVAKIYLLESEFSQFKHNLRRERLGKIAWEAAEQSERAMVPVVEEKGQLTSFLQSTPEEERKNVLVAMERAETKLLTQRISDLSAVKEIGILVGPEGGFSENEKSLIGDLGLTTFSLGKRILRMETAVILALGIAGLMKSEPKPSVLQ